MIVTQTRRGLVFVATVSAGFVIFVAAAYACVPQVGSLVVEGLDSSTTGSMVVGDGDPNTNHFNSWCGNPEVAAEAAEGDDVRVTVAAADEGDVTPNCPENDSQLPQGNNDIYVHNTDAYIYNTSTDEWEWNTNHDPGPQGCFFTDPPQGVRQGDVAVDANGDGQETFDLDGMTEVNDPNEASLLCVGDGDVGIFAPLVVTSTTL